LNLGHTFGHALEAEAGYDGSLLHGEAVGIGMVLAAKCSHKLGYLAAEDVSRIEQHMKAMALLVTPKQVRQQWDAEALMQHMANDKKARDGKLTLVLMKAVGRAYVAHDVDAELVRALWEEELA
jgi:3-dehydroquinate synthetase